MTQNSNENDEFKEWREVKIIVNVSHIWSGAFLVNFAQCFSVFITDFEHVNNGLEG